MIKQLIGPAILATGCACLSSSPVLAAEAQLTGKILQAQGHVTAACRMVQVRRNTDAAIFWFRVPDTGADNSILAVALSALTSGLSVVIDYDASVGSGCGTEPRITYISLISN